MYRKPTCLCGHELYLWAEVYTTNEYKILKNGKFRERPTYKSPEDFVNMRRLRCDNCETEYCFNIDGKGRLVRDEIMNEGNIRFEDEEE